jgi:uncharacterized protein YndB with AHSA1/START domain
LSRPVPGSITSAHRFDIPIGRAEMWDIISDVDAYRSWWPWLRRFQATGLTQGGHWHCEVQPPLPYVVRFQVHLVEVEAPVRIEAEVTGDVVGSAHFTLLDQGESCVAELQSTLAPSSPHLRFVARLASPIARFGHDWVLESGARQFVQRAIRSAGMVDE